MLPSGSFKYVRNKYKPKYISMLITDFEELEQIEMREAMRAPLSCYQCGLEPEYHGGLCSDCLFDRTIALADL